MTKFIIHIGPHKTGTTYLQLSFRALRAELAARGTIFPEFWELAPGNPSQLKLTNQLREGQMELLRPRFAELLESGAERILISSEDLSNLDTEALQRLRGLIGAHEVRIVFYPRRWSDLAPSSWQEGIKHGQSYTFPEFMLAHLQRPDDSRLLNFDIKLSAFTNVFGMEQVSLVSYSELRDQGVDLFNHFCQHFLDWADPPPGWTKKSNESRNPGDTELLRALNAMGRIQNIPARDTIRRAFDRVKRQNMSPLLAPAMARHVEALRLNDHMPALARLHEALAAKYLPCMLVPRPAHFLFRPKNTEIQYIGGDYMAEQGVSVGLRQLFNRVRVEMDRLETVPAIAG